MPGSFTGINNLVSNNYFLIEPLYSLIKLIPIDFIVNIKKEDSSKSKIVSHLLMIFKIAIISVLSIFGIILPSKVLK